VANLDVERLGCFMYSDFRRVNHSESSVHVKEQSICFINHNYRNSLSLRSSFIIHSFTLSLQAYNYSASQILLIVNCRYTTDCFCILWSHLRTFYARRLSN